MARPPHRQLRPGVLRYSGYRLSLGGPRQRLEVPDGAVTLVIGFEHRMRVTEISVGDGKPDGPCAGEPRASLVSALRTRAVLGEHAGELYRMEVVLAPWAAYTLFGVAMHEWAERIVHPGDLIGERVNRLADTLAWLPGWEQRFRLLDTTLTLWWDQGRTCSPHVVWAWHELRRTAGAVPVRHLVAQTGWSWRQLENCFREQIGLCPKRVARIMRLHQVLRLLADGVPAAEARRPASSCHSSGSTT